MFSIDKQRFGAFVAERRKALGLTQRELAERLYISDKAVSKWERGASLPDVALLVPLAEALEVSVTELLECRRVEPAEPLASGQVEELVVRAIRYGESRRQSPREKKRSALRFAAFLLAGGLELALLAALQIPLTGTLLLAMLLGEVFGCYFWVFAPQRLPAYYDEAHISAFSDGPFRMNLPGVRFHNRNWPHILRLGRLWAAAAVALCPMLHLLLSCLAPAFWTAAGEYVMLALLLGGLFVPMILAAKKYE